MPASKARMPRTLRKSPAKARRTYAETLESAEKTYGGNEERAHRAAFASLKKGGAHIVTTGGAPVHVSSGLRFCGGRHLMMFAM